jgi:benzoate-CoA ligase
MNNSASFFSKQAMEAPAVNVAEPKNILPDTFNFAQYLMECNQKHPSKIAFIDDSGQLSYGELAHKLQAFAAALLAAGVRREERALLLMHDCNEWPVSFLGAMYAGIVPVAVNTLLTSSDYAFMLQNSRAQLVIVSEALLPVLQSALEDAAKTSPGHEVKTVIVGGVKSTDPKTLQASLALLPNIQLSTFTDFCNIQPLAAPASTSPHDIGFWLFSSGSTGKPKGAVHTHANPYYTATLYGTGVLGLKITDVCFSAAKLFFAYGLGNALTFPMSVGATTILMAERPTPDAVFKRWTGGIAGVQPTIFFGAPTGFAGMLASPNLPNQNSISLRLASTAGEALPADIGERFSKHYGIELVDGIGSTEMLHIYLSNRPGKVRYGTTGWPVPGYDIQLRSEDGQIVANGEVGDLYINGPSAAIMYWRLAEKSRDTFQGAWTKSGDKYVCNADGSYTYSGRSDDMLKVSGIYVSPFEVEATLVQHASVLEAAVIGITDEQGLTKTKAFVVLKDGQTATETELKAFVKDKLAPYKYPRTIEFIAELPKTATGKIQRFKLREKEST